MFAKLSIVSIVLLVSLVLASAAMTGAAKIEFKGHPKVLNRKFQRPPVPTLDGATETGSLPHEVARFFN
eukprot:IDg132t1